MSEIILDKRTTGPGAPATGEISFYAKDDKKFYTKDADGVERAVGASSTVSLLNNVYVSMDGVDLTADGSLSNSFRTIGAAITYINDNYTPAYNNPYMIRVSAGFYEEDPFTLEQFVGIAGEGYRTVIKANNSSANFITALGSHTIKTCILYGVTGTGVSLVKIDVSSSTRIAFQNVAFNPYNVVSGTISNGVYLNCTSGNVTAEFENCDFDKVTGDCIHLDDNAEAVVLGVNIFTCPLGTFLKADSNSTYSLSGVTVINSLALGIDHVSTGGGILNNVNLRNADNPLNKSNNAEMLIQGSAGSFADATVTTLEGFKGNFFDELEGEDTFRIMNEVSIGVPGIGKELCVGEGDSYSSGMVVYNYDGTTYTSLTEAAKSSSGSPFGFPSSGSTRELYLSTTRSNLALGDFLTFQGLKIDCSTAASSDGEFVAEYWNGTSWVEFNTMSTEADGNYYPYAKLLFERTGKEQIRFTKGIIEDWTKNDPMSLGTNLYWVRFRADTVPTTLPVFEKFKVHSNRTELNSDGFIEYFGEARPVLSFALDGFQAANNSPSNQDLYFQDNFGVGYVENLFADGAVDQASKIVYLPSSVCTACPLRLKVILVCTGNSTAQSDWTIRWVINKTGDSIYTSTASAPSTNPNVQSLSVSVNPTGQYEQFTLEAILDISDYIADNEDGIPDVLGIQIQRNGNSDSNDDDIAMAAVNVFYVKINEGSHI